MTAKWCILCVLAAGTAFGADSVDVTFRYQIAGSPTGVSVPGEFNSWNSAAWPMTYQGGSLWTRTSRIAVGGKPGGSVAGAWQYKFYYNGVSVWPNDPLNHHVNHAENDNSFLYVKDPTIYQVLPNQRNPLVTTSTPTISAYIFPKVGSSVDTSSLGLVVDGALYAGLGESYDPVTQQFSYTLPVPLANGGHTVILRAGTNADTVTFTTQAGYVQLTNRSPFATWKTSWILYGLVQDSSVTSAKIVRNGTDTFSVAVTNAQFSYTAALAEGPNTFTAVADSSGGTAVSAPVIFTRRVNHDPNAVISFSETIGHVGLSAASSTDPDSGQTLSFLWSADPQNPEPLPAVDGATSAALDIARPLTPGDYFIMLVASDTSGNRDTTRNYFTVAADNSVSFPGYASNPSWARRGRIYFLFPKAASQAGTIAAAAQRLGWIRDLGFNIIWLMPVMKNAYPIDNNYGPGYNIVDFTSVAPEYGTNQDLKDFVAQAHALGLKVILDITTNHSSRSHPWSVDAHTYKTNSPYWGWYEHQEITANTNGLGDCLDADGFNYYCAFSDQLLNFNWKDVDMQAEMIDVLRFWIRECGVDGYRFDVYWGPHRRYGERYMGQPVRLALKHLKPDILLLGEDDATGAGSETIFADYFTSGGYGGVDAAYDWQLYHNSIASFGFSSAAIDALQSNIDNSGYSPGPNALFMRFMEDQDEDRIVYFYSNNFTIPDTTAFRRTMPMASVLFTIPGLPELWNGQEIGWGYGIGGSKEARNRSVIDWSYKGKDLLAPHYQKLATLRGQFPAFTQHKQDTNHDGQINASDSSDFYRVPSSNNIVYAFTRPYQDQNGLTVVNFSGLPQTATLDLTGAGILRLSGGIQLSGQYYLNNLYGNSFQQTPGSALDSVSVELPPYGTAIYTVSTTRDSLAIANPVTAVESSGPLPAAFALLQNYPNPFNPATVIRYAIARQSQVQIAVYNILGQRVALLADGVQPPGSYAVRWDAEGFPSGIYFYRLATPGFVATKKMLLVR